MTKILWAFWCTLALTSSAYAGYQIELPINQRVMVGITAPYVEKSPAYKKTFPFSARASVLANKKIPILDAIDMNLSDNNVTQLFTNTFPSSSITRWDDYGFRDVTIEVSSFNSEIGAYEHFSTANTLNTNTLKHFESGRGYYVRVVSTTFQGSVGLILDENYNFNTADHKISAEGWHMITMGDDLLSQSSSAIFIPAVAHTFWLSAISREFLFNTSMTTSVEDSARNINHDIRQEQAKGYPLHMVAYPAQRVLPNAMIDGVVIVSDSLIETSSTNAISITERELNSVVGTGGRRSLQENMVAIAFSDPTPVFASKVRLESLDGEGADVELAANVPMNTNLANFAPALQTISNTGYGVYKIDGDFNDTPSYDHVLLASDNQFGIQEKLGIRAYQKTADEGRFIVDGRTRKRVYNLNEINNYSDSTHVYYHDNGDNTFIITSTVKDDLELIEEDGNIITSIETNHLGHIAAFYKDLNIFNSTVQVDNYNDVLEAGEGYASFIEPYYPDLSLSFAYSRNLNLSRSLQYFNAIGYQMQSLYTRNFTNDSWLTLSVDNLTRVQDLDKQPSPIGSIYKEKSYFIQLTPKTESSLEVDDFRENCTVAPHFNNSNDGETFNNVVCRYAFGSNINIGDNLYTVVALVQSQIDNSTRYTYELVRQDGEFSFVVDAYELGLEDTSDYNIIIAMIDANGNQIAKQPYTFHYKKPAPPKNLQTNELLITNETLIYRPYISDIDQEKNKLAQGQTYVDHKDLTWDALNGQSIDLLAVNKDSYGLYSDTVSFTFYPTASEGVVTLNNEVRNGYQVQFTPIVNNVSIYFEPLKKTGFIGSIDIMFLMADNTLLGSIVYDPRYDDKTFYVQYGGQLYYGVFVRGQYYGSDSNPYELIKAGSN